MPVSFNQSPIDMLDPIDWADFFQAIASTSHNSTSWSASNSATGETWQFTGVGFGNYQNHIPFTGTITGITYRLNGVTQFTATGASVDVLTFLTSGLNGDWVTAVAGLYNGADTIVGTSGADRLYGFASNDTLSGGDGTDYLDGGAGDDVLNGDTGNDVLDGGNEIDTLNGGDGADTLYGRIGGDTLNGDADNDTLFGGDGDDTIGGGAQDDVLDGGNNNDVLYGRQGNDTLNGAAGDDALSGGDGDDTFVFMPGSGADIVVDFAAGGLQDSLDLSAYEGTGITYNAAQVGADTVFTFSNGDTITLVNVDIDNLVQTDPYGWG